MINITNSIFQRVIVHNIYAKKRENEYSTVKLSNEIVATTEAVIDKLKDRINEACGKTSKSFELDIIDTDTDSFFYHFTKIKENNTDEEFVKRSQFFAQKLAENQKRMNIKDAFLIIIEGVDNDNNFIIVIKAEPHTAFTTSSNENNSITSLELIEDIFLSPATKFYKIGIIYDDAKEQSNDDEKYPNNEYSCLIFDDQFRTNQKPAEYFYKDFLGFSIDKNPKMQTKKYLEEVTNLIKKSDNDYKGKTDLIRVIHTILMSDKTNVIDPMEIGERYLSDDDNLRRNYSQEILTNFPRTFVKDNALIVLTLKRKQITFPNKVKIEAPEEFFDENVKVITDIDNLTDIINNPKEYTVLTIKGKPYES